MKKLLLVMLAVCSAMQAADSFASSVAQGPGPETLRTGLIGAGLLAIGIFTRRRSRKP